MFDVKDYATVIPASLDADAANVMRQALAGMLWSKQFYYYDVDKWLEEHDADPFKEIARRLASIFRTGAGRACLKIRAERSLCRSAPHPNGA